MTRHLFVLIAAAASLAGCSSQDIPQAHKGRLFDKTGIFALYAGGDGFKGPILGPGTKYTGLYPEVRMVAQQLANERGERVWFYPVPAKLDDDGEPIDQSVEVAPEHYFYVAIQVGGRGEFLPKVGWDENFSTREEAETCAARARKNDGWDAKVVEVPGQDS